MRIIHDVVTAVDLTFISQILHSTSKMEQITAGFEGLSVKYHCGLHPLLHKLLQTGTNVNSSCHNLKQNTMLKS